MRSPLISPTNRAYRPSVSERFLSISLGGGGITGLLRDHPVYRAQRHGTPDERLGDLMLTDLDISGAKQGMWDTIISEGWEIEGSGNEKDFVSDLLDSIPNFDTVLQMLGDGFYYGWRLLEKSWTTDGAFKGRKIWKYGAIEEREMWEYYFSPGPDRRLIHFPLFQGAQQFTTEEEEMWFVISRFNSISRPYGRGVATDIWFDWYRRSLYREVADTMYQQALNGQTVLSSNPAGMQNQLSQTDLDAEFDRISASLEIAKRTLNEFGLMVLVGDLKLEETLKIGSVEAWEKINQTMGLDLRRRIEMSTLTTVASSYGTYGQGMVQRDSKINSCCRIAEIVASVVNDQIIAPALRFNFGDVQRDKIPRLIMNISRPVDLKVLEFFLASGIDLDGDVVAGRFDGIPLATDSTVNRLTRPITERVSGILPPANIPPPIATAPASAIQVYQAFDPLAGRVAGDGEVSDAMSNYFKALRQSATRAIGNGDTDFLV